LLDGATGEIISKDGRTIVSSDGIAGFSWKDGVSGGGSKGGNGGPGDTVFRAPAATGVEIPEDLSARASERERRRERAREKMFQV
jgi:hypothetical protein